MLRCCGTSSCLVFPLETYSEGLPGLPRATTKNPPPKQWWLPLPPLRRRFRWRANQSRTLAWRMWNPVHPCHPLQPHRCQRIGTSNMRLKRTLTCLLPISTGVRWPTSNAFARTSARTCRTQRRSIKISSPTNLPFLTGLTLNFEQLSRPSSGRLPPLAPTSQ